MTEPQPAPPRAADPVTDDEFASMVTDTVAGTSVDGAATPLGNAIYNLVLRGITHERNRCASLCQEVRTAAAKNYKRAEIKATALRAAGREQTPEAGAVAIAAATAAALAGAFDKVGKVIMLGPDVCKVCRGTKLMPSRTIAAANGQAALVECAACKKAAPAVVGP